MAPPVNAPSIQYTIYGLWLQSGAIIASALGVIITVIVNGKTARRRATLDLIMMEQTNQSLIDARREFNHLRNAGHLAQWAAPDKVGCNQANIINNVLNRYELISIALINKTLNEQINKDWLRTGFVKDWIEAKSYIVQLIQNRMSVTPNSNVYWSKYEISVKRWATAEERTKI